MLVRLEEDKGKVDPIIDENVRCVKCFQDLLAFIRKSEATYTKQQRKAPVYLAYIYFMEDYRSHYVRSYPGDENELERKEKVVNDLDIDIKKFDKYLEPCRKYYRLHQDTPEYSALISGLRAAKDTMRYFEKLDYTTQGYTPDDVINKLDKLGGIIEKLEKIEQRVKVKMEQQKGRLTGGREKNLFEDPL